MKARTFFIPGVGLVTVPKYVSRVDSGKDIGKAGWHGWQVRWPGHRKFFSDARYGQNPECSLKAASLYVQTHFPGKASQCRPEKGVRLYVTKKPGRNVKEFYVSVSHPQRGRSERRVYVGTERTVTQERIAEATAKAQKIRKELADQVGNSEKSKSQGEVIVARRKSKSVFASLWPCESDKKHFYLRKERCEVLGFEYQRRSRLTVEQKISDKLFFEAEKGTDDDGCYNVTVNRFQQISIPSRHLTPDDLRAMADHLEAQRQNLTEGHGSNDELTPEQKTADALRSLIRALPTGTKRP